MWAGRRAVRASSRKLWQRSAVAAGVAGVLSLLLVTLPAESAVAVHNSARTAPIGKLLVALQDPDGAANDGFGESLAIAGSTVVIGSPGDSSQPGNVYVFVNSGQGWPTSPTAALSDPKVKGRDHFGESVAVSDKTIVVGAPGTGINSGAVYIYVRRASGWPTTPTASLRDPKAAPGDDFGRAVSVSGKTLVIGGIDPDGSIGTAYIYAKGDSGWPTTPSFTISDPNPRSEDEFGASVAVSGNSVIVGAYSTRSEAGAAYIYVNEKSGWPKRPSTKLPDPSSGAGGEFGESLGVSGSAAIIGAPGKKDFTGATYVYSRKLSDWRDKPTVHQKDPDPGHNEFGIAVGMSGNAAIVGTYGAKGVAYLYVMGESGWPDAPSRTLSDPARTKSDEFGKTVAVSGTTAVVGGPGVSSGAGAVYLFEA